jgi:vacuolar-type H+-ATPase subunit E/Vma4
MPLETILQTLEAKAAQEAEDIREVNQAEVEQILSQARQEADEARQKHVADIRPSIRAEQARITNHANLQALQIVLGTREEMITAVLEKVAQRLSDLPNTELYPHLLCQLTQEAVDTLGRDNQLCLRVQRRDVDLMREISRQLGLQATVEADLKSEDSLWGGSMGGLIVSTQDERVKLVNTLELRLQQVAQLYRSKIAELLFGLPEEA